MFTGKCLCRKLELPLNRGSSSGFSREIGEALNNNSFTEHLRVIAVALSRVIYLSFTCGDLQTKF